MSIFIFIILLFFVLLFFVSSLFVSVLRWVLSLFGIRSNRYRGNYSQTMNDSPRNGNSHSSDKEYHSAHAETSSSGWHYSPEAELRRRKHGKVIKQDEGEYVDFEEIK